MKLLATSWSGRPNELKPVLSTIERIFRDMEALSRFASPLHVRCNAYVRIFGEHERAAEVGTTIQALRSLTEDGQNCFPATFSELSPHKQQQVESAVEEFPEKMLHKAIMTIKPFDNRKSESADVGWTKIPTPLFPKTPTKLIAYTAHAEMDVDSAHEYLALVAQEEKRPPHTVNGVKLSIPNELKVVYPRGCCWICGDAGHRISRCSDTAKSTLFWDHCEKHTAKRNAIEQANLAAMETDDEGDPLDQD